MKHPLLASVLFFAATSVAQAEVTWFPADDEMTDRLSSYVMASNSDDGSVGLYLTEIGEELRLFPVYAPSDPCLGGTEAELLLRFNDGPVVYLHAQRYEGMWLWDHDREYSAAGEKRLKEALETYRRELRAELGWLSLFAKSDSMRVRVQNDHGMCAMDRFSLQGFSAEAAKALDHLDE